MTTEPDDHRARPTLSLVEYGSALGQSSQVARRLAELTALIAQEARLLNQLSELLRRQRAVLTAGDGEGVSASVQAMGRILLTLDSARRGRAEVVGEITGDPDTPIADLERRMGRGAPESLPPARDAMHAAAEAAARELAVNQGLLRSALEAGDAFLQRLFSGATPSEDGPEPRRTILTGDTECWY
jgi:flagellar FlgN protein